MMNLKPLGKDGGRGESSSAVPAEEGSSEAVGDGRWKIEDESAVDSPTSNFQLPTSAPKALHPTTQRPNHLTLNQVIKQILSNPEELARKQANAKA